MATPSEVYHQLGDALAAHLGVAFGTDTPKKGRKKAGATGMSFSLPVVYPAENVRYGSGTRVDFIIIVTASNRHDILKSLDDVVQWIQANRNAFNFELLLKEANAYYSGENPQTPELVGYAFEVTTNL